MDIDAMGKHIHGLLAFKDKIEAMIEGANVDGFMAEFNAAIPLMMKAASDVAVVIADLDAIKKELRPALAWIAEQQQKKTTNDALTAAEPANS